MKKTRLVDFCKSRTQKEVAALLGCSQSAVSQMLKAERDIYVVKASDHSCTYFEIKSPAKAGACHSSSMNN